MRFASPQGFNTGDHFYTYLQDAFDVLYAEGDDGAEDAVDRHALPAPRPARAPARAAALPRPRPAPRQGLDLPPHRHRPPLGTRAPLRRACRLSWPRRMRSALLHRRRRRHHRNLDAAHRHPRSTQRRRTRRVHRAARRHLRALALDRGAGPPVDGPSPAWRSSSARWCEERPRSRSRRAARRWCAPTPSSPARPWSPTPHRGVDARAGPRRPGRLHAGRIRADRAAQCGLQREVRLAVHPGRARPARHRPDPRGRSSPPSSAGSPITRTSSSRECLRNIHRIAELRLDDKFGATPELGNRVWDWAERLARHSDPGYAEHGQLTVTYLTEAHRACAALLVGWMRDECGFDDVRIDAVGNVVGALPRAPASSRGGSSRARTTTRSATPAATTAVSASSRRWPACASSTAPAGACRSTSRSSASPRRKASATRPPSSAPARWSGSSTRPGSTSRMPTA